MDQQTKAALKQDNFVDTTNHGLEWASANRRSVIVTVSILFAVIVLAVGIGAFLHYRTQAASAAFGEAMDTYQAPVAVPGQPAMPGVKTYPSVKDRAKAANDSFRAVAAQYGWTTPGKNAKYFAGLTYGEMGQTQSAETILKEVSGSFDRNLASLAKFALADIYRQTNRDPEAITLYQQLADKPTAEISAGLAQIQLAELYAAEGKSDQARKIYAQLKDKDKDASGKSGAAGTIAAQKLNPSAAPAGPSL